MQSANVRNGSIPNTVRVSFRRKADVSVWPPSAAHRLMPRFPHLLVILRSIFGARRVTGSTNSSGRATKQSHLNGMLKKALTPCLRSGG